MKQVTYWIVMLSITVSLFMVGCNRKKVNIDRIKLVDLDNKPVKLSDFKGKTVVLNFWATWCGPCLKEKPSLDRARQILEKEDFVFVALSEEEMSTIQRYAKAKPYGLTYLKTTNNIKLLGVFEIPQTYVINKNSEIIYSHTGFKEWDSPENIAMLRELAK